MDIVKDTPTTVVMDANNGMGMVASYHMMEMLIEKAAKYGMAGGAVYNSTHYGIAGYWTTMAEKAGMIGITGTNARPSVQSRAALVRAHCASIGLSSRKQPKIR